MQDTNEPRDLFCDSVISVDITLLFLLHYPIRDLLREELRLSSLPRLYVVLYKSESSKLETQHSLVALVGW